MAQAPALASGVLALLLAAAAFPAPAHPFPETVADEWTEDHACWRQAAEAYADHQAPNASAPSPAVPADVDSPGRLWLARAAALGGWEAAPPHDLAADGLGPALVDLYEAKGLEVDADRRLAVAAFAADLDPRLRAGLAPLVERVAHAVEHHQAAYEGPGDVDQPLLVHAADGLLATASAQAPLLDELPDEAWPDEPVRDPVSLVAVGTPGNDTYDHHRFLEVDPAGDDEYHNNAGGAWVPTPSVIIPDVNDMRLQEVALHLELGGEDVYGEVTDNFLDIILQEDNTPHAAVAAQGGAQDAVGVMVEWGGNDTYVGGDRVQGGTFRSGVGVAWDRHGNDSWEADGEAQGGSRGGVGMFLDENGDDDYHVAGTGIGYADGEDAVGVLADSSGTDVYDGESAAMTGYGEGKGLGTLIDDGEGNDSYLAHGGWAGNNQTWIHNNTGVGCDDG